MRPPKPPDRPAAPRTKGRPAGQRPVEQMSLRDFIREPPTQEELNQAYAEIDVQKNHRAAAIIAAAFVEDALRFAFKAKFRALTGPEYDEIFDAKGPLSSFQAAINLGYAMSFYESEAKSDLHVIRRIRNAFAHAMKPVTFATVQISKEVDKLKYINWKRSKGETIFIFRGSGSMDNPNRETYANHCRILINDLIMDSLGIPRGP